jgi:hypothetical protein
MDTGIVVACAIAIVVSLIVVAIPLRRRLRMNHLLAPITLVALVALVGCLLWLAIRAAREAAVESSCHGRMCQIALALQEYRDVNRTFLPRSALDVNGRTLRWPEFLSRYLIYDHMDGPEFLAEHFRCPNGSRYLLVAGPGTTVQDQAVTPEMVSDGLENTLVAIEAAESFGSQSASYELTLDDLRDRESAEGEISATRIHSAGRGLVFADGALYRLLKPLSVAQLRTLMTINGGERLTREQLEQDGYLKCLRAKLR